MSAHTNTQIAAILPEENRGDSAMYVPLTPRTPGYGVSRPKVIYGVKQRVAVRVSFPGDLP